MTSCTDRFGFLPYPQSIDFGDGHIDAESNFAELWRALRNAADDRGFVNAPIESGQHKNRRFERASLLFGLPPSHRLHIKSSRTVQELRASDSAFLIHFLGALFGVRQQFEGWWIDLRVPAEHQCDFYPHPELVPACLARCYQRWRQFQTPENQQRISIAAFVYSRAMTCHWDWEQFTHQYMVLDALYNVAVAEASLPACRTHSGRIEAICKHFDLAFDKDVVDEVVVLRNNLLHEATWDGGQPCTARPGSSFLMPYHLDRFNRRLLLAVLGFRNTYVGSTWWTSGSVVFD